MAKMKLCGLTGVDEHVDIADLERLSEQYPMVEWGILYSPKRQGQPGRYPSYQKIKDLLVNLSPRVNVALHICGGGVVDFVNHEPAVMDIFRLLALRKGRVQLNFNAREGEVDVDLLLARISYYHDVCFITQHNANNAVIEERLAMVDNHAFLVDSSLGNGVTPDSWPIQRCAYMGYAGGLGPDNIADAIPSIEASAGHYHYWIDMEGKLRTEDRFDLKKAEAVLNVVASHVQNQVRSIRP